MDKKEALKILIEHSFMLTEDMWVVLVDQIPKMTAEQIEDLGYLLAMEKRKSLEQGPQRIKMLDDALKKILAAEKKG